jgi:23S rRNA (pseudouridine1915-N3)-methyltransferase
LWFGRPAASPYEGEVETYRSRVARRWPAEDVPLKPAAGGREEDPRRALRAEAEKLCRRLPDGWATIVLDEHGELLDSEALARELEGLETVGTPGASFVIGSDLGLDPALRQDASRVISLGRLTYPHQLARLVLWEQLYRAADILSGGRYHRHALQ